MKKASARPIKRYQGFGRTFHSTTPNLDKKENRFVALLRRCPAVSPKAFAKQAPGYLAMAKQVDRKRNKATDLNDRHWAKGHATITEYLRCEFDLIAKADSEKRRWRLDWYAAQRAQRKAAQAAQAAQASTEEGSAQ